MAEWEVTEIVRFSLELETKTFPRIQGVSRDCIVGVLEVELHYIINPAEKSASGMELSILNFSLGRNLFSAFRLITERSSPVPAPLAI